MSRADVVSVVASDPNDPNAKPITWKVGDPVLGDPDLIVRQLVLFNGGVTVFAVPSAGSKTELTFIQHTGSRRAFIFNLAASTIKMTVAMATVDDFEEIRHDTYENADDNFDEEPDDPEEEEVEEEEIEAAPVPAPPAVAPAPQPSFLPAAETFSDATESP
jgi:hypothetical protein